MILILLWDFVSRIHSDFDFLSDWECENRG